MRFSNGQGLFIGPFSGMPFLGVSGSGITLDAVGESIAVIGKVFLEGATGSKTISSAGGGSLRIGTSTTASVFVNAGTNLRIGIQDITGASGLEDGTFDVFGDLVGGTDTFPTSSFHTVAMDSGTKTLSHLQEVAIVIEMTARGGADTATVGTNANSSNYPYSTADTGGGVVKATVLGTFSIGVVFDDGTIGWIAGVMSGLGLGSTGNFNSGSNPNEIGNHFTLPNTMTTSVLGVYGSAIGTTDAFDVVVYSDPFGTPVAIATASVNPLIYGNTTVAVARLNLASELTLLRDTPYAIVMKPTSVNDVTMRRVVLSTGNEVFRRNTLLGENWGGVSRASGAFTADNTILNHIGFFANDIRENKTHTFS